MRVLFFILLSLSACGGSGSNSTGNGGGGNGGGSPSGQLSFTSSAPTDVYYPSASYPDITITITNTGTVNTFTQLVVTMDGVPYTSPGVPTLNVGDTYQAHILLLSALGSEAVRTFVVTSPQYGWTQTFIINTHLASNS